MSKTTIDFTAAEVAKLPPHQRKVMTELMAGLTYAKIAELNDIALGTVRSRINRARETIKLDREAGLQSGADSAAHPQPREHAPRVSKSSPPDEAK